MLLHEVFATLPEDPDLAGYVRGSQYDHHKRSGLNIFHGDSYWDVELGMLKMHHTEEDKGNGLRAYIVDVMDTLKCHQDFQFCNDHKLLAGYLTKYVSKFSDSLADECLNDDADATSIACNVCMRYKPMEPEMLMQMWGQRFRQ